ncbi:glycoside hydrolase TIM-barrel-like domain-containing protein [Beijerinckia sp. L45]|uniref:baseplate megatron protein TIM-barrel domain-containing protein n=1 Tax=Beijerinckia sp. L45 TaxID=1641855 RepID=UPI00131BC43C|nr:glycoside hydrolase TIM-barrel-like domain-containing protein [Beijerinckia sp. L45]
MTDPRGVALLPASGEWVYDPLPHRATALGASAPVVVNLNAAPAGTRTDYSIALDQLQARYPGCTTVSLVVAWFGNAVDVTQCAIYPATNVSAGPSDAFVDGTWAAESWRCSGLTAASPGLIPLSTSGGSAVYGGTPSDPSVVRCIRDLRGRGLRVVFYPFLLMDCAGYPWRGRITFAGADISAAATSAVAGFLGSASASQFTRDTTALTVAYVGAPTDWTFRRMILHYANLCVIAGGVDLFLIGSELRGLEILRGPGWTKAGTLTSSGAATWDYPFVAGLAQLAADVRGIFDAASLPRAALKNLIAYSADWSDWMGVQHVDSSGQWPHLDALYAHPAIDLVSFDNYLPLSDWTTGDGGLDAANWNVPAPSAWPPTPATMNGLGLSSTPSLWDKTYLKANIEGGEKYDWFYADSTNQGRGPDPGGSDLQVSRPEADRLAQNRSPYAADQQPLANKQLRWWWHNSHQAIYDAGDGLGFAPHGPATAWAPQSKSIIFAEFGFPSCDRATNQPNVFYDPKSSESFTPFWSIWDPAAGATYQPRRDDLLARLALESVVEYWTTDGHNAVSAAGLPMVEPTFMVAWNWDARPFPAFPALSLWGDAANWPTGTWLNGKDFGVAPALPDPPPIPPPPQTFPNLAGQGWSVRYRPVFATAVAAHVTGRESRFGRNSTALWQIDMSFDRLSAGIVGDLATLAGFYDAMRGAAMPFLVPVPAELGLGATLLCRFAQDQADFEEFMRQVFAAGAVTLVSVR